MSPRISRRRLLQAGITAGAGAALLDGASAAPPPAGITGRRALAEQIPFEGVHQAGILTPRPRHVIVVAFDVIAPNRAQAGEAIALLSDRARALTAGHPTVLGFPGGEGPTPETGILGVRVPPDALTVTIGVGASLFDDRFGLRARRPAGLVTMPAFPDDDLAPQTCHGDVLVQLCANTEETLINALRDLARKTRAGLAIRWKADGFQHDEARERGAGRNLLGFKDGTSNPDVTDDAQMKRLVWTDDGGTFAVVRVIRNRVEFWDRVGRLEQELMIGRSKATGAPLGKHRERADPDFASDPKGDRIPVDAHIRLANPRTTKTDAERILRRGYNYSRGVDEAGQLDMGLLFVAFNRDLQRQFTQIQKRLAGEPLVDYIKPTGGGYFYLPPGASGPSDWVGSGLFT